MENLVPVEDIRPDDVISIGYSGKMIVITIRTNTVGDYELMLHAKHPARYAFYTLVSTAAVKTYPKEK